MRIGPQHASLLVEGSGLREITQRIGARARLGTGETGRAILARGRKGWFSGCKSSADRKKKKTSKMKGAPNNVLKTKRKMSDIMDYPNKVLKESDLNEISY
jgi:hypothetical protein